MIQRHRVLVKGDNYNFLTGCSYHQELFIWGENNPMSWIGRKAFFHLPEINWWWDGFCVSLEKTTQNEDITLPTRKFYNGVFIKIIHCRNFMVNLQQVFMFPPLLFCTAWSHLCPSMTSSLHENLLHYRQYAAHLLSSAGSASVEGFPQVKPPHLSLQVRKIIMFIHTRTHKTLFTWKLRHVFFKIL